MSFPKLILDEEFDDLMAFEVESKGCYFGAKVMLNGGEIYSVCFYDLTRLRQDLEADGRGHYSVVGLIVLESVTRANMQNAISTLDRENWFDAITPINAAI